MTGKTNIAFGSLAAVGVALGLLGVGLELVGAARAIPIEVPSTVYWCAMLFGFVGFFGLNPDRAERGANVATNVVTRVLGALPRFGRRASDAIAVPGVKTTTTALPTGPEPDDALLPQTPAVVARDERDGIEPTP